MHIAALIDSSIYRRSVVDHAAWVAGTGSSTVELLYVVARNEHLANRMPVHPTGAIILADGMTIDEELSKVRENGEILLAEAETTLRSKGIEAVRTHVESIVRRCGPVLVVSRAFRPIQLPTFRQVAGSLWHGYLSTQEAHIGGDGSLRIDPPRRSTCRRSLCKPCRGEGDDNVVIAFDRGRTRRRACPS